MVLKLLVHQATWLSFIQMHPRQEDQGLSLLIQLRLIGGVLLYFKSYSFMKDAPRHDHCVSDIYWK